LAEALIVKITRRRRAGGKETPRVLLARAKEVRPELARMLRAAGVQVAEVAAYETRPERRGEIHRYAESVLAEGAADAVVFTSGSTVGNFVRLLGAERLRQARRSRRLRFYSIGPVTSQTMRKFKLPIAAEAARHDLIGLAELLLRQLGRKTKRTKGGAVFSSPGKEA
jgi:uroporphyrinogen III methyltransferase/synthase